jgi:hypothetical protein
MVWMMAGEVFVDTAFVVALASHLDQHYAAANQLASGFTSGTRLVTTRAVCLEVANALSYAQYRAKGLQLLNGMEKDRRFEIVPLSEQLYAEGMALFSARRDKEWSLTDCISFLVMWDRGISKALTADHHFSQAGFEPLLRSA